MKRKDVLVRVGLVAAAVVELTTLGVPFPVHADRLEGIRRGVEVVNIPETTFAREWGLNNWGVGFNADFGGNHVMVRFRPLQDLLRD